MSKRNLLILAGSVVFALTVATMLFVSESTPEDKADSSSESVKSVETKTEKKKRRVRRTVNPGKKNSSDRQRNKRSDGKSGTSPFLRSLPVKSGNNRPLTAEEQKLHDDIQESMDSEDAAKVRQLCKKITLASKRELREHAVNALGWFDRETMADLTKFLADPDEDIASDALFQWQEALNQIESEAQRADIVGKAMSILQDENALEQLSMELNGIDEKIAVETIVGVINGNNPAGVKVGKEAYEFLTGENYTTPADADKWLQENYTPPEP